MCTPTVPLYTIAVVERVPRPTQTHKRALGAARDAETQTHETAQPAAGPAARLRGCGGTVEARRGARDGDQRDPRADTSHMHTRPSHVALWEWLIGLSQPVCLFFLAIINSGL